MKPMLVGDCVVGVIVYIHLAIVVDVMAFHVQLTTPGSSTNRTNWSLCVLCQEVSDSKLVDPNKVTQHETKGAGFTKLAINLTKLAQLNELPFNIELSRFDEGEGIQKALVVNNAKWHKVCFAKCSDREIVRAEKRLEQCIESDNLPGTPVKKKLRTSINCSVDDSEHQSMLCLFCDLPTDSNSDPTARTMTFDKTVRTMAHEIQDRKLLGQLSAGDAVALDVVYHKKCYTDLYTKYRSSLRAKSSHCQKKEIGTQSVAFAELISFVEEFKYENNSILKLSDLVKMYTNRLRQLGDDRTVNTTRLKEALIEEIPGLEAHTSKKGVILSFNIGDVLLSVSKESSDSDALAIMRAARIIRRDIFAAKYQSCNPPMLDQSAMEPRSLVTLVQMILGGTSIPRDSENPPEVAAAALSITQLLVFNSLQRERKEKTTDAIHRHNPIRETALPLYLGLLLHSKTRKRDLVDTLFQKGLCVSYDRVLQVSSNLANEMIVRYEEQGVVCPSNLRGNVFTTGNFDNIDHNTTANTAQSSFHGSALSLTNHITYDNPGTEMTFVGCSEAVPKSKKIASLPEIYTSVPPAAFPVNTPVPSKPLGPSVLPYTLAEQDTEQRAWLEEISNLLDRGEMHTKENISWSAHFAEKQVSVPRPPAITGMMPLFRDNAHSLAMVKHAMNLISNATEHLNPGQTPVFTVDQPLFAIAKKIQWTWPELYGEDKIVILMGGLHIEMAFLSVMGEWLEGSGWAEILANSNVTTEGRASALEKGSHTSRCQWAHQVTLATLAHLLRKAYSAYEVTIAPEERLHFDQWCKDRMKTSPQFYFWSITMKLELLFMQFMYSQREGNYTMYLESLSDILPWMFALDHVHYSRWMSVHLCDLLQLNETSPLVHAEFVKGNFVTQKAGRKFSMLAHDQIHEQLNAVVKGEGGVIGITENDAALRRWTVGGPEISRLLKEYEVTFTAKKHVTDKHHEQTPSIQKCFAKNVQNVVSVIEEQGNPFSEEKNELITLASKVIMSQEVVDCVRKAEAVGKKQHAEFVADRLTAPSSVFYNNIKKNNLTLFSSGQKKSSSKANASRVNNMKRDVHLFSRMYVSCQNRDVDMDTFFKHENHAWPPSLANNNEMRITQTKADILNCLEPLVTKKTYDQPDVQVKILDGAALVQSLDPVKIQKERNKELHNFDDFSKKIFLPYVKHQLSTVERCDVVWDRYLPNSLKSHTRQSRGSGVALRVERKTKLPSNWKSFLRVDSNKTSLFHFLATEISTLEVPDTKVLCTTLEETTFSDQCDVSDLQSCNHEEADTRMLLHSKHAYSQGFRKIMIVATDTDVVLLAVAVSSALDCELWVSFCHGTHKRYIAAHEIARELGPDVSWGLLFFHAFTGCDTVSTFSGIGKTTAWNAWMSMKDIITPIFTHLSKAPKEVSVEDMALLERFTVVMYKRTSPLYKVNQARIALFTHGDRNIENIPPTQAALVQHTKRAAYQGGHIWGQCLATEPEIPLPSEWGWTQDSSGWLPKWTTLPEASKVCRELIKCNCKRRCSGRCKCSKAGLQCTHLCACSGQCAD